jgi:folylpolyglutamate synthase/dihydropteroate synthase
VEEVAAVARPLFQQVETAPDPADALERACGLADEGRYVLVTGSLYLVGNILGVLEGVSTPGQVSL